MRGLSDADSKMLRPSLREMTDAPTMTPWEESRFIRIRSASESEAGGGAGRCGARARGVRRVAAKEGAGDVAEARRAIRRRIGRLRAERNRIVVITGDGF
jgi:hypothetical protein